MLKYKTIQFLLLFLLLSARLTAQPPPPCVSNPVAGDFCNTATAICNLNGYCGNTSATYTHTVSATNTADENNSPLGNVFCAGIQNNSWLKFMASSSSAVFDVWVSNCTANDGIQMQIYATSDCYNFTAVSNCWNPGSPTNGQITAAGLVPGQVYFFMIDGRANDVCDYVISTSSGVTTAPTITANQSICPGAAASLSVSGGSAYTWSSVPADPTLSGQLDYVTVNVTPTITTTYTVTVTNPGLNGFCPDSTNVLSSEVSINNLSSSISASVSAHCGQNNGSATVLASGGSDSYSYLWNTTPQQTSQTAFNLGPGSYGVTVSDGPCTSSNAVVIGNIGGPALSINNVINASCNGSNGSASAVASGGTPPYTYLWNSIPAQSTANLQNVTAGNYEVTVTDNTNCITTQSIAISSNPGPAIQIDNLVNENCNAANGGVNIIVSGGTPPYTFLWNSVPAQTSQNLLSVAAGNYTVTVADANNCSEILTAEVLANPLPLAQITNIVTANCGEQNGSITVGVTAGQPPYTYSWNTIPVQTTPTATNLGSGIYNVTVVDANACESLSGGFVAANNNPILSVTSSPEHCDQSDGSAEVNLNGGLSGYTFLWSNGQSTAAAVNLAAGTYTVTVSNAFCTANATIVVGFEAGPTAELYIYPKVLDITCDSVLFMDYSSGDVVAWHWTLGDGSLSTRKNLKHLYTIPGLYPISLLVTDAYGCTDFVTDTILVRDIFTFYIPNAFTPNGDNLNDIFTPYGLNVDPGSFDMVIFNRWGQEVFQTDHWVGNEAEGWNGTWHNAGGPDEMISDIYVYRIRVNEITGNKHLYSGKVLLIK